MIQSNENFLCNTELNKEKQEIKYKFSEIYETFLNNSNSIEIDLPRLNVIFYFCNSIFEYESNNKVNNITEFKRLMKLAQQKLNCKDIQLLSYFCNQDMFGWVYYIISKLYSDFDSDDETNIMVLDSESSMKLIKISFSNKMIFYYLFGSFKLIKLNKISQTNNNFELQSNIDYYVTMHFEISESNNLINPEYIHLHWIFTE